MQRPYDSQMFYNSLDEALRAPQRQGMDQSGTYAAKAADEGALDAWKTVVGAREGRARMANDRGSTRETLANALARAQMQAELERARQAMVTGDNAAERDMKWKMALQQMQRQTALDARDDARHKDSLGEAAKDRANKLDIAKTHRTYPPAARAAGAGGGNLALKSIESSINGLIKQSSDLTVAAPTWNVSTEGLQMAKAGMALSGAMNATKNKLERAKYMILAGREDEGMRLAEQATAEHEALSAQGDMLLRSAPKAGAPGAGQQVQAPKPAWNEDGP
jgi:hypothetical protein